MVRMSDVVRGIVRDKPTEKSAAPPPSSEGPLAPAAAPRPRPEAGAPRPAPPPPVVEPPCALEAEPSLDALPLEAAFAEPPAENAGPLFAELQLFLARVREIMRTGDAFPWSELEHLVERCVVSLDRSGEIFWVASNTAALAGVDYLVFHQRRLDALSMEEQALYRSHPRLSVEWIRRWSPPSEGIVEAVLQHHEREQGQGFPQSLHGTAVGQDAKILGLVDTYTGLTMPPPPRPRLRPHEAIREIVRTKHEFFPASLVKALLSEVSVFPPGTLVRLNTGEVGRVTAANRNHPLRPRVEIIADGKGQRLPAPKTADLGDAPFLYITGAVAEGGR
jgi:HD domain